MTDSQIKVEVAFDNLPSDADQDITWTDVTDWVRSVSTTRGRSQELSQYQAGRATIELSNADRRFDPTHLGGPYADGSASNVAPMKRVRVRAAHGVQALSIAGDGSHMSSPDSSALSLTGDMTLLVRAQCEDWVTGFSGTLAIKQAADATPTAWRWHVPTPDVMQFDWADYAASAVLSSSAESFAEQFGWAPGETIWFRLYFDELYGPFDTSVSVYWSRDKSNWSFLGGADVSQASMVDSNGPLEIGSYGGGALSPFAGHLLDFEMWDGLLDVLLEGEATRVASPRFVDPDQWSIGDGPGASAADAEGNVWSITGPGASGIVALSMNYPMFDGFVDTWQQNYVPPSEASCTLQVTDGFKVLQGTDITVSAFGLEAASLGPVHWWRLDEPSGSTVAFDAITGLPATVAGDVDLGEQGLLYFDADGAARWPVGDNTSDHITAPDAGVTNPGIQALRFRQTRGAEDSINAVWTLDASDMDGYSDGLDIRVRLRWPGGNGTYQYLFGKGGFTSAHGYYIGIYPDGSIYYQLTGDDDTVVSGYLGDESLEPQIDEYIWIAFTAENTSGSSWDLKAWYDTAATPSGDVTTWTQYGATVTRTIAPALEANAVQATVGARGGQGDGSSASQGSSGLQTEIVQVQLRNDVNGTLVANPDFSDTAQWTSGDNGNGSGDSGVDAQGNTWTIRNSSGGSPTPIITSAGAQAFSISAVVQWDLAQEAGQDRYVLSQGDASGTTYWRLLSLADGTMRFEVVDGGGNARADSTSVVLDGEFHHLVATYSPAGLASIYVDGGAAEDTDTYVASITDATLRIGHRQSTAGSGNNWAGTIDEVMVWDRELTATEVGDLYALTVIPWADDRTGTRLNRVLDGVGWSLTARDIDLGNSRMQSQALEGTALDLCQNIADSELFGALFIDKSGRVRFIQRQSQYGLTASATFGDAASGTNGVSTLTPDYGDWLIRNEVSIERNGGATQRVVDPASRGLFLPHSFTASGLNHNSDDLSLLAAQKIVEQYAHPVLRVAQITVTPRRDPAVLFPAILDLELGDWVDVEWTPQGVGDPITITSVVEQITHSISAGQKAWTTTFNVSPAPVGINPVSGPGDPSPPPTGAPLTTGATGASGPAGPQGEEGPAGPAGPTGPTGPQGEQGELGPTGPQGEQGDPGPTGDTGAQGPAGATGPTGPQGDPGADGSRWYTGVGTPDGGLGVVGDYYLDEMYGIVYEKTGVSTWTSRANLTGPDGDMGPTGPPGAQGEDGPQGPTGATGATGSQGPTGPTGPQGDEGPQGPTGPEGSLSDTGWITSGFTAGTGWSINVARYRVIGGISVFLELALARTDADIDAPASGNIGNQNVIELPAGAQPSTELNVWPIAFTSSRTNGGGWITNGGTLTLASMNSDSEIRSGDNLYIAAAYAI